MSLDKRNQRFKLHPPALRFTILFRPTAQGGLSSRGCVTELIPEMVESLGRVRCRSGQ